MTKEQKQALIERCEKISQWREKYGDYANVMLPAVEAQQIAQIALSALIAPTADLAALVPDAKAIRKEAGGYAPVYSLQAQQLFIDGAIWFRAAILHSIELANGSAN